MGYDPLLGARPVKRIIQRNVLNELSKQMLQGAVHADSEITVDVFDGKIVFYNKEISN